mgnify:FL=1
MGNYIYINFITLRNILTIYFFVFVLCLNTNAQIPTDFHQDHYVGLHHWEIPSKDPDRIILTFNGDPSSSRAVTWRTDSSVNKSVAQIAISGVNSSFSKNAKTYNASTEKFDVGLYKSNNSY